MTLLNNAVCTKNCDPFGKNHGVSNCIPSCLREFSPLFQLFHQSGKGFRGVVGPHHLYGLFLEVDFVYFPIAQETVLEHGECGNLFGPF